MSRHSSIQSGRTIAERREKLETASERAEAHKRSKKRQIIRIILTVAGFIVATILLIQFFAFFFRDRGIEPEPTNIITVTPKPTIEVIDNATSGTGITTKMSEYIGQAEIDFKDLGYNPTKAVIPTGAIREVDIYLDGYTGFIKMITDRDTAVSVEDADRTIRYLKTQGVSDFLYIDVRIEGKAYWK